MNNVHAKRWLAKGRIRYQPRQGDIGLYRYKNWLSNLPHTRFWSEDIVWRWNPDEYTPVLYKSKNRAINAGRRFDKRHTYKHPHPTPLDDPLRLAEVPFLSPPTKEEENAIRQKYGLPRIR